MNQRQPRVRRAASSSGLAAPSRPSFTPISTVDGSARALHTFGQLAIAAPAVQRCACSDKQDQDAPAQNVQFKLTVNTPGDVYEQEADATADQVMRMSAPSEGSLVQRGIIMQGDAAPQEEEELQMKPLPGASINLLQRCACEDEAQRQEVGQEIGQNSGGGDLANTDVSGVVSSGLASGGRPLDAATRSFMEPRFGHDFSQVRIHDNTAASGSASAVSARAYTVGNNIAFRSGEFAPDSGEGRRLLAHELTHVVQQGASAPLERSVQRALWVSQMTGPGVQRDDDPQDGGVPGGVPQGELPEGGVPDGGIPDGSVSPSDPNFIGPPVDPNAGATAANPSADGSGGIPQLSTPVNDALGVGLGVCGLAPGPVGTACTLAGGAQSATQGPTDPTDPNYSTDRAMQGFGLATTAGSLLGVEAAGPIGLVGAAGMAAGHGAQWLGEKMIEGGQQSNPGQFGPDPLDQLDNGQGY